MHSQSRGSAPPIARSDLQQLLQHFRTRHANWQRHAAITTSPRELGGAHGHASGTLAAIEDLEDVLAGRRPRERLNG